MCNPEIHATIQYHYKLDRIYILTKYSWRRYTSTLVPPPGKLDKTYVQSVVFDSGPFGPL